MKPETCRSKICYYYNVLLICAVAKQPLSQLYCLCLTATQMNTTSMRAWNTVICCGSGHWP